MISGESSENSALVPAEALRGKQSAGERRQKVSAEFRPTDFYSFSRNKQWFSNSVQSLELFNNRTLSVL